MSDIGNDIPGLLEQAAKDKAAKHAADEARIAVEQQALRDAEAKALFERGEQPKAPKADPAIVAYVEHKWWQPLGRLRTTCFRCGADSPAIDVPPGQCTFGGPTDHGQRDNTGAVQAEFAKLGWRFEMRRSYCPACKGLGVSA